MKPGGFLATAAETTTLEVMPSCITIGSRLASPDIAPSGEVRPWWVGREKRHEDCSSHLGAGLPDAGRRRQLGLDFRRVVHPLLAFAGTVQANCKQMV